MDNILCTQVADAYKSDCFKLILIFDLHSLHTRGPSNNIFLIPLKKIWCLYTGGKSFTFPYIYYFIFNQKFYNFIGCHVWFKGLLNFNSFANDSNTNLHVSYAKGTLQFAESINTAALSLFPSFYIYFPIQLL